MTRLGKARPSVEDARADPQPSFQRKRLGLVLLKTLTEDFDRKDNGGSSNWKKLSVRVFSQGSLEDQGLSTGGAAGGRGPGSPKEPWMAASDGSPKGHINMRILPKTIASGIPLVLSLRVRV